MAIFHLNIKIISRGKGRSAVASAAYRAGEKIKNEYNNLLHDYTRKGGVVHTEILLPEHAPPEYRDRSILWNSVEKFEKSKNAQLAREIEVALPAELSKEQNLALVRDYVQKNFVDHGMCADVCFHDKKDGNPHVHIMLTMRPIEKNGSWGVKSKKEYLLDKNGDRIRLASGEWKTKKINCIDWNERTKAEEWRSAWATSVNEVMKQNGMIDPIDHRSYQRQGIDKIPSIHLGVSASQMERRGIKTDRGNVNRSIEMTNKQLRQLRARIKKLQSWLYQQPIVNPPTLLSITEHIADGENLKTKWQKVKSLKQQASILLFLEQNHITDFSELIQKNKMINEEFLESSKRLKAVDRRLDTLSQHLEQCQQHKKHQAVNQKYKSLDPKKREVFYEKYSEKLDRFAEAKQYLTAVLNGRTKIPINEWKEEQKKLKQERIALCDKFYTLKDDVHNMEVLRRGTEHMMKSQYQPQKQNTIDIKS